MADVLEVDPFANSNWILKFDGQILEIFGDIEVGGGANWTTVADSWRVHVKHLDVTTSGPDRHGFREVAFGSRNNPRMRKVIQSFTKLDDAQWDRFQPLLEALAKATTAGAASTASDPLLAAKQSAFQALISQHDIHLSQQPDDVRRAVVSEIQASGVAVDPDKLVMKFTDPAQFDALLEIYKRHLLLPPDASLG
jgi:hypothetical protein